MVECVVYTALTDKYFLNSFYPSKDIDYVAYMENGTELKSPWQKKKLERKGHPKVDTARYKMLPHKYFNCEYSVWLDSMIVPKRGPLLEAVKHILKNGDIAFWMHPVRRCIYEESLAIVENKKYKNNIEIIYDQINRYAEEGMPRDFGIFAGGIVIRRHTKEINEFGEYWYDEYLKGSKNDQLSLAYTAWKTQLPVVRVNRGIVHQNDFFHYVGGKIIVKNGETWWVGREQ
jgi:hypothetical protein|tara:strand:+ start:1103 stop:1795 length:693 start_codon:yes stop_codon:yes gene_type:complete